MTIDALLTVFAFVLCPLFLALAMDLVILLLPEAGLIVVEESKSDPERVIAGGTSVDDGVDSVKPAGGFESPSLSLLAKFGSDLEFLIFATRMDLLVACASTLPLLLFRAPALRREPLLVLVLAQGEDFEPSEVVAVPEVLALASTCLIDDAEQLAEPAPPE